jgi:acyl carrier protein
MAEQLRTEVESIFRDVFGDARFNLRDDMRAQDIPGWDSLAHLNLVIAMEKRLAIKFSNAEIARLRENGQTIGGLLELVRFKRNEA